MTPTPGVRGVPEVTASGALRFVRYAHAPNGLGLCGPSDAAAVWEHGVAGAADGAVEVVGPGAIALSSHA